MIDEVLSFWFEELKPAQWWTKDLQVDRLIATRFGKLHAGAVAGELFSWRGSVEGRLAEILILDQFSRNIYRNQAVAFSADSVALVLAQEAVRRGLHLEVDPRRAAFILLPYMHSESRLIHEEAVKLFRSEGMEGNYDFELKHKAIIDRFGRYPHRNSVLGRNSTPEELAFLSEPGSSF